MTGTNLRVAEALRRARDAVEILHDPRAACGDKFTDYETLLRLAGNDCRGTLRPRSLRGTIVAEQNAPATCRDKLSRNNQATQFAGSDCQTTKRPRSLQGQNVAELCLPATCRDGLSRNKTRSRGGVVQEMKKSVRKICTIPKKTIHLLSRRAA